MTSGKYLCNSVSLFLYFYRLQCNHAPKCQFLHHVLKPICLTRSCHWNIRHSNLTNSHINAYKTIPSFSKQFGLRINVGVLAFTKGLRPKASSRVVACCDVRLPVAFLVLLKWPPLSGVLSNLCNNSNQKLLNNVEWLNISIKYIIYMNIHIPSSHHNNCRNCPTDDLHRNWKEIEYRISFLWR